ncbi:MAG: hypothetical protein DI605_12750 [Sphingomonas sp.]|nr:MAG: hypothetical protein DI605_12750 [Sphingomonas sp.]
MDAPFSDPGGAYAHMDLARSGKLVSWIVFRMLRHSIVWPEAGREFRRIAGHWRRSALSMA